MLDAMPFATWHLSIFKKLSCDWRWIVVEGTAQNNGSTGWCQPQEPRLSDDGTTEYLNSLGYYASLIRRKDWKSKDEMVNAALEYIEKPCVLMEIDVDEIHTPGNIEKIVSLFECESELGAIKMPCRCFVGKNLICVGEHCWGNKNYEWLRAWRFEPGMQFTSHEPPVLRGLKGRTMERNEARRHGLTFDHYAYTLCKQAEFKEKFYGYTGLVNQWKALQQHRHFPDRLARFFPFVDDKVMVDRI